MVFVSCVNLCFIQSHKIFSCVFFYKFHSFTFWSMIPSKLIFISGVRLGLRFSFACEYPLVVPFVQDYPFPHWITWHLCWTKASLVAQLVKNLPALQADPFLIPWSGRSAGEGLGYPLQYSWTSLVTQMVKNLPARQEDLGSIPRLGWSPGGGHGNPLQCSCLENPHGQRRLTGCSPWGHKESDTTDRPKYWLSTLPHHDKILLLLCL